jgi:predicted DNA-binding transcriptional regulator AlpA
MQQGDPILLRTRDIIRRYGIGKSWFLELVAAGVFPQPKRFGTRMSVWRREELDAAFANPELPAIVAKRNDELRAQKQARTNRRNERGANEGRKTRANARTGAARAR